jgi:hypothetical protein
VRRNQNQDVPERRFGTARKLDLTEEAKLNTTTWLGEYIERIAEEIEEKDFEIERLSSGKARKQTSTRSSKCNKYTITSFI